MRYEPERMLTIPRCWAALLGHGCLAGCEEGQALPEDPEPYRNDFRELVLRLPEHDLNVAVTLNSGESNYWMDVELWSISTKEALNLPSNNTLFAIPRKIHRDFYRGGARHELVLTTVLRDGAETAVEEAEEGFVKREGMTCGH